MRSSSALPRSARPLTSRASPSCRCAAPAKCFSLPPLLLVSGRSTGRGSRRGDLLHAVIIVTLVLYLEDWVGVQSGLAQLVILATVARSIH